MSRLLRPRHTFVFVRHATRLGCVSCTHSLLTTWAETWCWCQRSLNPAGWSPWLQRLCRHGDRQQKGDRKAGWGVADSTSEIKSGARAVRDWERRREGCGWAASDADVAAVRCWVCVCLCACARMHKKESVCVKEKREREQQSALPALCVAISLANTPHPLSVLLSQDSDTQMLVDASSQSSYRKDREKERGGERGEGREGMERGGEKHTDDSSTQGELQSTEEQFCWMKMTRGGKLLKWRWLRQNKRLWCCCSVSQ